MSSFIKFDSIEKGFYSWLTFTFHSPKYMTAACALGQTKEEVDVFVAGLSKAISELKRKREKLLTQKEKPSSKSLPLPKTVAKDK